MASGIPVLAANGAAMPALGLGTWQLSGEGAFNAVAAALAAGYRHIDTAAMYGNEAEVGEAIRASGVKRGEIFLTTKIWHADIAPKRLPLAAEESLKRLGFPDVDLLLIHWPNPSVSVTDSVRALCGVKRAGLARNIGISNHTTAMIAEALQAATEPLAANQCEYHPRLDQAKVIAACKAAGIAFTSYCPIGRGAAYAADSPPGKIAARLGKSAAQVVLRWHIQQGVAAIPKSGNAARIKENIAITDFELTAADMAAISAMKQPGGRIVNAAFAPEWDH